MLKPRPFRGIVYLSRAAYKCAAARQKINEPTCFFVVANESHVQRSLKKSFIAEYFKAYNAVLKTITARSHGDRGLGADLATVHSLLTFESSAN